MPDPKWFEVSYLVNGELAEAISEVLGRFVEGGVAVESAVRFLDAEDEGTPTGPVRIYGYIPADLEYETKKHKLDEAIWHLSRIQSIPSPVITPIEDQDWMNSWKKNYHPIEVGKKLLILPAWIDMDPAPRIPLRIDPSMAFGTGTHPTTQLCLEMLEQTVQPGDTVIDVGCGSGILSIAAIKLGAKVALAVDIDPLSVKATGENSDLNDVRRSILVGQGSVTELRRGDFQFTQAPLVVANILAPVIIRLFDDGLADLVLPGGILILSGILDTQAAEVIQNAESRGLNFIRQTNITDWVAITLKKAE